MAQDCLNTNLQILGNFHLTFIGIIRGCHPVPMLKGTQHMANLLSCEYHVVACRSCKMETDLYTYILNSCTPSFTKPPHMTLLIIGSFGHGIFGTIQFSHSRAPQHMANSLSGEYHVVAHESCESEADLYILYLYFK